jgi:hypothetical protein
VTGAGRKTELGCRGHARRRLEWALDLSVAPNSAQMTKGGAGPRVACRVNRGSRWRIRLPTMAAQLRARGAFCSRYSAERQAAYRSSRNRSVGRGSRRDGGIARPRSRHTSAALRISGARAAPDLRARSTRDPMGRTSCRASHHAPLGPAQPDVDVTAQSCPHGKDLQG